MKGNKDCYKNRELSWLLFNERVLNEAANPRVPLMERLPFISIYQTNLDEFFMVRVGTLMEQKGGKKAIQDNKTGLTGKEQVKLILKEVKRLERKRKEVYEQLMGELEPAGIHIINFQKLSKEEQNQLELYFDKAIRPYLSPVIVGKQQPFPFLQNRELYAVAHLETKSGKKRVGIVPCWNPVFKRLIEIPGRKGYHMLSEELILHFVSKLYPAYQIKEKSIIRVTRNADIDAGDVYDEDLDYRGMMEQLLKKRKRLNPVRLELTRDLHKSIKKKLASFLGISEEHVLYCGTPLDLSFLFALQNTMREHQEWYYPKYSPRASRQVRKEENIFSLAEKKDILLSYPFESMRNFISFLQTAATDDSVRSIKITLYRMASHSQIVEALCDAAENGKEVLALVELRARFDEASNIEMSRRLEDAGCQVIYGLPSYKVHSKLCLVTRQTAEGVHFLTQIGTGNYNEKTATLYTDLSLITANQNIGRDAQEVFRTLLLGETVETSTDLLVAPRGLQEAILEKIRTEGRKAEEGRGGYIGLKLNALTDKDIIDALIEASEKGAVIQLLIRGICCLIPGIPGKTENITVHSVVGRYLEHSRIYRFGQGDAEEIYIASADFMTRNTLRRVEVAAPIYDEENRNRVREIFNLGFRDTEKGKVLLADGLYHDPENPGDERFDSQDFFYREAYKSVE